MRRVFALQELRMSYDGEWLDRMYNNRARVPEHATHFERWATDSAHARRTQRCVLDQRYGSGAAQQLDIFPTTGKNAPVLFFIHGGWWRSLDKRDHSFVAPAFTSGGACVVVPNYTLAPQATIPEIALEMVRALAWTWRHVAQWGGDPSRITVAGHSAGGHLASLMLACAWQAFEPDLPPQLVRNALSISGLHDLDPVRHIPFLEDSLRLTAEDAVRASPALLPPPAEGTLYAVAGADESDEFIRQARVIQQAWGRARVPVCESLEGLNHYTVLETLADPASRLHSLAVELLRE
jgi:arylformamidase